MSFDTGCSPIQAYAATLQGKCRVGEQITERDMKALIYGLAKGSLISIYLLIPGKGECSCLFHCGCTETGSEEEPAAHEHTR